jgi:hypothetical protein
MSTPPTYTSTVNLPSLERRALLIEGQKLHDDFVRDFGPTVAMRAMMLVHNALAISSSRDENGA